MNFIKPIKSPKIMVNRKQILKSVVIVIKSDLFIDIFNPLDKFFDMLSYSF